MQAGSSKAFVLGYSEKGVGRQKPFHTAGGVSVDILATSVIEMHTPTLQMHMPFDLAVLSRGFICPVSLASGLKRSVHSTAGLCAVNNEGTQLMSARGDCSLDASVPR